MTKYGLSLTATANDIAFALSTLRYTGFLVTCPANIDLQAVACQMLGISDDVGVESLVSELAKAVDEWATAERTQLVLDV